MGLTACRSVPLHLLLYPSQPVCQGGRALGKRIAAPVCTPRALASRRGLARNDKVCRGRRPRRPVSAAAPRCHSEPVTAPVCGLARNDKVRRGERPCPPHATAAPCRAGSACPAGSNAYFAAGHMGPALRDLRLTHPAVVRKADTNCE